MNSKNQFFLASLLLTAVLGLGYSVMDADSGDSILANAVSDHDAEQLFGGEVCVKMDEYRCSAYGAVGGLWFSQVCPEAEPSNRILYINCGDQFFAGVTSCGGAIPDSCRVPGGTYLWDGRCVRILSVPGCTGSGNPVPVFPVPPC